MQGSMGKEQRILGCRVPIVQRQQETEKWHQAKGDEIGTP